MVKKSQRKPRYTVEEYLEIDRQSDEKLEYVDGEIVVIGGVSIDHTWVKGLQKQDTEDVEMVAQPKGEPHYTVEQYLEMDRNSDEKLEYVDGEIVAMTGASRNHSVITINISTLLSNQLRDTDCVVQSGDMRVNVQDSTVSYRYPDVTVVCGEECYTDENPPSLLNPTVIVEVLSPSTQATDRGPKVDEYQNIPSLQAYLMVAQDRPWVVALARNPDGRWWYDTITDMTKAVMLPNPACEVALAEVYRKAKFNDTE